MDSILNLDYKDENFFENLSNAIRLKGVCLINSFYDNEVTELRELQLLADNIFTKCESDPKYKNGKCITFNINNKIGLRNKIKKYFYKNLLRKDKNYKYKTILTKNKTIKDLFLLLDALKFGLFYSTYDEKSIYLTLDKNNTSHSAQKAHYDWHPSLKAMIYLNNCQDPKSGGLFYRLKSNNETGIKLADVRLKGLRPGRPGGYKANYNISQNKSNFSYCGACAGSILIFNTDGHHYQGENIYPNPNKIIRLHSYLTRE